MTTKLPPALEEEDALTRLRDIYHHLANIPPALVNQATKEALGKVEGHIRDIVRRPAAKPPAEGTEAAKPLHPWKITLDASAYPNGFYLEVDEGGKVVSQVGRETAALVPSPSEGSSPVSSQSPTPGAVEAAYREGFSQAWGDACVSSSMGYAAWEDRAWENSEARAALAANPVSRGVEGSPAAAVVKVLERILMVGEPGGYMSYIEEELEKAKAAAPSQGIGLFGGHADDPEAKLVHLDLPAPSQDSGDDFDAIAQLVNRHATREQWQKWERLASSLRPSQDSQEVREAGAMNLIYALEAAAVSWHIATGRASNGAHDRLEKARLALHAALLSQSPKGAAGAGDQGREWWLKTYRKNGEEIAYQIRETAPINSRGAVIKQGWVHVREVVEAAAPAREPLPSTLGELLGIPDGDYTLKLRDGVLDDIQTLGAAGSLGGLTWTREKPTAEGWYWLRLPGAAAQIEFIMRDHENGVSKWYLEDENEWEPILDGREWAGPIVEPTSTPEAAEEGDHA